jgi:hypothetical protein
MIDYPSEEWFNEAREYNTPDQISCPACYDIEQEEDMSNKTCKVCGAEDHEIGYNHLITTHLILNKIEVFKELKDDYLIEIINDLKKQTFDCPECSSIDDEQYTCTSCWGANYSEFHYLIMELNENKNEKDFAERLSQLDSEY